MRSKILITIACLIIVTIAFGAGYNIARKQARQKCIEAVAENCEYICGVGAEFYYPDKHGPRSNDTEDYELVDDSLVAQKGDRKYGLR